MKPYEDSFVRRIKERIHKAHVFRRVVTDGLREFLGDGPSQVLLLSADPAALDNPTRFAVELSSFFGLGAIPILDRILAIAENPVLLAEREAETARLESIMTSIGPASNAPPEGDTVYLHDHRTSDDFSEEDAH